MGTVGTRPRLSAMRPAGWSPWHHPIWQRFHQHTSWSAIPPYAPYAGPLVLLKAFCPLPSSSPVSDLRAHCPRPDLLDLNVLQVGQP